MRLFLIGATLALVIACRKDPAPPPLPDSSTDSAANASANAFTDSLKVPIRNAGLSPNAFLALSIACGRDSLLAFYNDTTPDRPDTYIRHRAWDSTRTEYGIFLERAYYEGGDWLFVSKATCAQIELPAPPIMSPGGSRFASAGSFYSDYEVKVVIARMDSLGVKAEINETLPQYGSGESRWGDDSSYAVVIRQLDQIPKLRKYEFREGAWNVGTLDIPVPDTTATSEDRPPFPEAEGESDSELAP